MINDGENSGYDEKVLQNYFKTKAVTLLNKPEFISRVVDHDRSDKDGREKAWAFELNDAFTRSFNMSAREHLTGRISNEGKISQGLTLAAGVSVNIVLNTISSSNPLEAALLTSTLPALGVANLISILENSQKNNKYFNETLLSERRFSLNPIGYWQPDRFVATLALNNVFPIIRYRK